MTLLLDWFAREGRLVLVWWLWITLAGLAVFPLCLRFCSGLPDRGYSLARALGLLLVTWVFWLLGSYGFLINSSGGIALSWLLVLSVSFALYFRNTDTALPANWLRENRAAIVATELIFAGLFLAWSIYRAHQNGLTGTEKPMELAFLSAAQRSISFPPNDPWMSGYAISYYYMGYVMSSMLSTLSGISSTIGFNLTNAALFSLTGATTFGVVYNLVRSRSTGDLHRGWAALASRRSAIGAGLLGVVIMALMGNFQFALIEAPLQSRTATRSYLEFWGTQRLPDFDAIGYLRDDNAILNLDTASWPRSHWWWFNASRVPTDYSLDGQLTGTQPIGEFPAFSFLLADNHPHVLSLPFVVAAIGLMLNLLLSRREPLGKEVVIYGLAIGGLSFLNAWDGPTLLLGLVGAEALRRLITSDRGKLSAWDWLETAKFGAMLVVTAALAYLPYYIGFRSQAGGILPNLLHPSQIQRFFIMFGPLIVIIGLYLVVETWRGHKARRHNWRLGITLSGGMLALMLLIMTLLSAILAFANPGQPIVGNMPSAAQGEVSLLQQLVERRIENGLTTLLLLAGVAFVIARLFPSRRQAEDDGEVAIDWIKFPPATGFVLLLIGMGLCLTLLSEFFYLRDNFFVRINTVFKLYYQTWVLWSIAAAYAVYSLLSDLALPKPNIGLRIVLGGLIALSIFAGLLYIIAGVYHRGWIESGRQFASETRRYEPPADWPNPSRHVFDGEYIQAGMIIYARMGLADASEADLVRADVDGIAILDGEATVIYPRLTLDGAAGLLPADDMNAIRCLDALVGRGQAVVAEAEGRAYDIAYGRVGAVSGIPNVLGWVNHERQWRGASYYDIAGSRSNDLKELYTRYEFSEVEPIIERYQISHIFYGATERRDYGRLGEEKFLDNLTIVCESGESRIYYAGE